MRNPFNWGPWGTPSVDKWSFCSNKFKCSFNGYWWLIDQIVWLKGIRSKWRCEVLTWSVQEGADRWAALKDRTSRVYLMHVEMESQWSNWSRGVLWTSEGKPLRTSEASPRARWHFKLPAALMASDFLSCNCWIRADETGRQQQEKQADGGRLTAQHIIWATVHQYTQQGF